MRDGMGARWVKILIGSAFGLLALGSLLPSAHASIDDTLKAVSCAVGGSQNECKDNIQRMIESFLGKFLDEYQPPGNADSMMEEVVGDPAAMAEMCMPTSNGTQGCIPRFHEDSMNYYNSLMANTGTGNTCNRSTVGGASASALIGMMSMTSDFFCLSNDAGDPCAFAIADAVHGAGLDDLILQGAGGGDITPMKSGIDMSRLSQLCTAFYDAGCCSKSFFEFIPIMSRMLCHESAALGTVLKMLPTVCQMPESMHGIGKKLPDACPGWSKSTYEQFVPEVCPKTKTFWTEISAGCPTVDPNSCPTDMCEFGCMSAAALVDLQKLGPDPPPLKVTAPPAVASTVPEPASEGSVTGGGTSSGFIVIVVVVCCAAVVLIGIVTVLGIKYSRTLAELVTRQNSFVKLDQIVEIPMTGLGDSSAIEAPEDSPRTPR